MKNKIILGTVQLGIPYGINNSTGKPSEEQAFDILDLAFKNNVRTLDTADGYGDALNVIGRYKKKTGRSFQIINKFKADAVPLHEKLQQNLYLLQSDSLLCYMYHQFSDYENGAVHDDLLALKRSGKVSRIGLSLYSVEQLRAAVNDLSIDIIQLPVNILDLGSEKESLLKQAKANGKEIHARSIYLQGIFFKNPDALTGNLTSLRPYLEKLNSISVQYDLSLKKASLNFVLQKGFIDAVVLGIDLPSQLEENFALIDGAFRADRFKEIEVSPEHHYLLNPANWKP